MGYTMNNGRYADTVPVELLSGVIDSTGESRTLELGDRGAVRLAVEVSTAGVSDDSQVLTFQQAQSGTFTLSLGSTTTGPIELNPETLVASTQSALDAAFGEGSTEVSGAGLGEGKLIIKLLEDLTPEPELFSVDTSELVGKEGKNEIQRLQVDASEGSYTLSYSGDTSAPLDYDAGAAAVQTALEALESIGEANVSVSADGSALLVEFVGELAEMSVALLSADNSDLAGGTVGVDQVQEGREADVPQVDVSKEDPLPFEGTVSVEVQTSHDGEAWSGVGSSEEISGEGVQRIIRAPLDRLLRVAYTVSGGPATVIVHGEAV